MKRGERKGGGLYQVMYDDLEKAIKELGTLTVLGMINSEIRKKGMARIAQQGRRRRYVEKATRG